MTPVYYDSASSIRPVPVEIAKHTVFLRKDISEVDGSYSYKEAKMSISDFQDYMTLLSMQNAINGANDSENILKVLTGQDASSFNQLAIMEAFADLYELLLLNSSQ